MRAEQPSKIKFSDYHQPALPNGQYEIGISQRLIKVPFQLSQALLNSISNTDLSKAVKDKLKNSTKTFASEDEFIQSLKTEATLTDDEWLHNEDAIYKCIPEVLIAPGIKKTFHVAGERFHLNPKEIATVFPPVSSLGEHSTVFPHIMINRSTLPWERVVSPSDNNTPWLALLVIHENEEGDVNSLVMKLTETIKGTDPQKQLKAALNISDLEPGQSEADNIQVLQIKKELLKKICPAKDHLHYLAHVRAGVNDVANVAGTEMAVIIANRLPKKGMRSTVYLVSLENRFKDGVFDESTIKDDLVHLVQLHSWSFTCTAGDFTTIIKNLNRQTSTICKPAVVADEKVNKLLRKGFYPLPHKLRQGAQTVSWYHGPLGVGNTAFKTNEPVSTADSLLCYDEENGMIDVSYAAAWELGRLLALQNTHFATELYKWKQQFRKTNYKAAQLAKVAHLMGANRDNTPNRLPDSVNAWLFDVSLLQGVPFNYLVPDEELLPVESIRFFKLDKAWIDSLQKGSLSIGGSNSQYKEAENKIFQQEADRFKKEKGALFNTASGFILRSEVVAGWPALQVEGYKIKLENDQKAKAVDTLQILRTVNLSPNVKLCLFDGDLKTVSLHLKAEALHFGVDNNGVADYSKKWRDKNGEEVAGSPIPVDIKDGVLELDKLLAIYKSKDPAFTSSAHLAVQLLEGVDEVRWTV